MRILQAVTDDYIQTAEPVGSRTIARKYDLGVSPATIRNEMSDLEELGYLEQPHTSAGRVPSDKGYRFYVDQLMDPEVFSAEERDRLREEVVATERAMEHMIHRASRLLSLLTKYTAVVSAPRLSVTVIRRLQLTALDERNILVVLVTDPGFVRTHIVEVPNPVDETTLEPLEEWLNRHLVGKSLKELGRGLLAELREEMARTRLYTAVVDLIAETLGGRSEDRVYLDGTLYLFEQPEFKDVERAKNLIGFLEHEENLAAILSELAGSSGTRVSIGRENRQAEIQDCSFVTATYRVGGHVVGAVGLIGPTRLDYARAVAAVELMADSLSDVLTDMSFRRSS